MSNIQPAETAPRQFVIGIDTGGTYTDGVLMDYGSRKLLATTKHLTTREDLAIGVTQVLRRLEIPDPSAVQLVGISSTLATNSIAEGKTRDVGLALIGYDEDLLNEYDLDEQFTAGDYEHFAGGHDSQGRQKQPLDVRAIVDWATRHRADFDAFAVSGYFSPLNSEHEEQAAEAIFKATGRPVVMASQLSSQLDSIKRATTASLNASLVSVMQEFIEAVRRALAEQNIDATLMVVKGDGSLMPYEDAIRKPVETVVSGPAASAIGGYFLCDESSGLMIDVGGTTTDMALVESACVDVTDQGARVGDVQTAIKTARIRTACVGCDSRISYEAGGRGIVVGPERVTPLCRLAEQYPDARQQLSRLHKIDPTRCSPNDLEYWLLYRPITPRRRAQLTQRQERLVDLLADGPRSVSDLMRELDVYHPSQLEARPLLRQGYIEPAGLTPTDVLHVQNRLDKWDRQASVWGMDHLTRLTGTPRKQLKQEVFEFIAATIAEEVIVFLAGKHAERLPEQIDGTWGRWFFEEFLNGKNPLISVKLHSYFPTVGLGAPAQFFIEQVAEKLGSALITPEHHEVANAIGAVAGSIMVEKQALLFVQETANTRHYTVHVAGEVKHSFEKESQARDFAKQRVEELALEGAEAAGAHDPDVTLVVETEGSVDRYIAQAVGNPDLTTTMETEIDTSAQPA